MRVPNTTKGISTSGAAINSARYWRGIFTLVGHRIAARAKTGGAKNGAEGDLVQVFDLERDPEGKVVELDAGEDDREQEDGDTQAGRRALVERSGP